MWLEGLYIVFGTPFTRCNQEIAGRKIWWAPLAETGGVCYCGEMLPRKKSCACRVNHHGGFVHGPIEPNGYCFDCGVIKQCQAKPYQGPPCPTIDGGERCSLLEGHGSEHAFQGSLL